MELKSTKGLHSSKVKALVYAESGMGKTTLLGTLPEAETLIVSAESGLLCLDGKDISVVEVKQWADLQSVYKNLTTNPEWAHFKYVGIDSLTELSDMLVYTLENSPEFRDPKMALKMWGEFSKRLTATIKAFRGLDKSVIFTALTEDVIDNGVVTKKPYIKGKSVQRMLESYFDEVLYLSVNSTTEEREIQTQPSTSVQAKDRSGKLDNFEEANLTTIINKIRGNNNV
jgi:phage nucleotide-binding protein